jgi:trimeric autotransporter adhesin
MSKIEVDAIEPQSGTSLTLGASGDSVTLGSGANIKLDGNYPVGTNNVALGSGALDDGSLTGGCNTAIGHNALTANTTGNLNVAVGYASLGVNTTACNNTSVGAFSLDSNTTGDANTGLGYGTLSANTTASNNTAVGTSSLIDTTTGCQNTAVGSLSLLLNTTGSFNTAVGYNAGQCVTVGEGNVLIGEGAGFTTVSLTSGSGNVVIGQDVRTATSGDNYSITIGVNTTGKGSGTGFIDPNGGNVYQGSNQSTWATISDKRIKKNITGNTTGLEKINQIQVKNFEYKTPDEITELPQNSAVNKQGIQVGVIAQEIEQILPDVVKQETTGVKSVNPDNILWYLVNAVKELTAEIDLLKNK